MARTDTLDNFLTDVADAIREKTGGLDTIPASNFDEEIRNISGGGEETEKIYLKNISFSKITVPTDRISFDTIDTSIIKSTESMFTNSSGIKKIDISKIEPIGTNPLYSTFYGCTSLESVILPKITYKISSLQNCFYNCASLKKIIGLEDLTFNDSVSLYYAFYNCKIKEVTFKNEMPNISSLYGTFNSCTELETINIKANAIITPMYAFSGCVKLKEINGLLDAKCETTNIGSCFKDCSSLEEINIPNWSGKLTSIAHTFENCTSLKKLDIRNLLFGSISTTSYRENAFTNVPDDCLIIVNGDSERNWILRYYPKMSNIKTINEI